LHCDVFDCELDGEGVAVKEFAVVNQWSNVNSYLSMCVGR